MTKKESAMEHIARDIKAGIFPRKSEPLKDEKAGVDPNLVYPGKDADFVFPEE